MRFLVGLIAFAVLVQVLATLFTVLVVVGVILAVGHLSLRVMEYRRTTVPAGAPELTLELCCDARNHEGEAAICGCTNHRRSHLHPFGWPRYSRPEDLDE